MKRYISKILSLCITGLMVISMMPVNVMAEDNIDMGYLFPDSGFRNLVYRSLPDNGSGGRKVSWDTLRAITDLSQNGNYKSNPISKTTGIEYLENLRHLNIWDNYVKEVDISKNKKLEVVTIERNNLEKFTIGDNPSLTTLQLGEGYYDSTNKITKLDLRKCPNLKKLKVERNSLPEINLKYNTKLEYVNLWKNKLTKIDVSKNPALKHLDLTGNTLTELDVTQNPNLEHLECHDNGIKALDLSKNKKLSYVKCQNNKIEDLKVVKDDVGNASGQYKYFNMEKNRLPAIPWFKSGDIISGGHNYDVVVNKDYKYDMNKLPGNFEEGRSFKWQRGSVDANNVLTVDANYLRTKNYMDVTYDYLYKDGKYSSVNLKVKYIDTAKQEAKDELDNEAGKEKDKVDENPNLSEEEKEKAKDDIDKANEDAKKKVDEAEDKEGIDKAKEDGKGKINDKKEEAENKAKENLEKAKTAAKAKIEQAAKTRNTAIDKVKNAKAEDVAKAKSDVETAKSDGITQVNKMTTIDEVIAERDLAIGLIRKVPLPEAGEGGSPGGESPSGDLDKEKQEAKDALDKKAEEEKGKIDNNPNLNNDEKQKAKDDIDKATEDAKNKVDEAEDKDAVEKAKDDGNQTIDDKKQEADDKSKENLEKAKDDAKAELDKKAEDKKKEIDDSNASEQEKEEAKDKVDKEKEEGKKAIDNAKTTDEVTKEKDKTEKNIKDIQTEGGSSSADAEYEVSFDSNMIDSDEDNIIETRTIKKGKSIGELPKDLTDKNRPDYKFNGWYTKKSGGTKVTKETKIEKEMTIYAHWKKRETARNFEDVSGNEFSFKKNVYQDGKLGKKTRPYQLTVTAKPNRRMLIEWTDCKKLGADIDGYIITRKVGSSNTFVDYKTVSANRNYYIDTLSKKNTNYYYMVFGYKKDKAGNITISENSMSAVGQRLDSAKINPYAPKINYTRKTIREGESVKLRLTYPKNSISTWTRWRAHNDGVKVAKVNQQGVVTGVNKGEVLISARTPNGRDIRCLITVV